MRDDRGAIGRWKWGGGAWLVLFVLASSQALATHETDHRFTVYGTVHDDQGHPVADTKVIVVDPRLDEGMTAFTDHNGDYEALLHLHSTDLGDEIVVTALDRRKSIRAEFDPNDKVTVRKARVDFGSPGTDHPASGWFGAPVLAGAALVVGAGVAFIYFRRRQRRRHPASQKSSTKGR
ncbi:MAG TPA: carboxypeptidase-like regulatory domain-containing protein [Nitrospiria bacterium]|nr:carboxypeptidase-like regulatory domain-containing protein [Nitrospiria bacterium]